MIRIPHAVFNHILSFKDPTQQVGVRGGIQTDSARAMSPLYGIVLKRALMAQPNLPLWAVTPHSFVMTRYELPTKTLVYIWDTYDIHSCVHQEELECIAEPIQTYVLRSDLTPSCDHDIEL